MDQKIRKYLDEIYEESETLPENFGDAIFAEVKEYFQSYNYEITRKTVTEALFWCYMCLMQ